MACLTAAGFGDVWRRRPEWQASVVVRTSITRGLACRTRTSPRLPSVGNPSVAEVVEPLGQINRWIRERLGPVLVQHPLE